MTINIFIHPYRDFANSTKFNVHPLVKNVRAYLQHLINVSVWYDLMKKKDNCAKKSEKIVK